MVSIPACHTGDRGSIPRRGDGISLFSDFLLWSTYKLKLKHFFYSQPGKKRNISFEFNIVSVLFQKTALLFKNTMGIDYATKIAKYFGISF